MKKTVLILEGGAMRSLYTSGVLDVLMEKNIDIECLVGVSAGALVGSNYISNQKGRSAKVSITHCVDSKYIGIGAIKRSKGLVGFDYLFEEICTQKIPFDMETFQKSTKRFVVGATNCITGKTEYFEKDSYDVYKLLQASASMPIVSQIVDINGQPYLDGAIDCNIPLDWALEEGYEKIVVILTRDKNYRKKPVSSRLKRIYNIAYKKYPKLLESIYDKPNKYNCLYEKIENLEKENKIFVFQPKEVVKVSRLEKNQDKLRDLYNQGIKEAEDRLEDLKKYLEI